MEICSGVAGRFRGGLTDNPGWQDNHAISLGVKERRFSWEMSRRIELYADGVMGSAPVWQEMNRICQLVSTLGSYVYSAAVSAARLPADYTARAIPHCDGVSIPLDDAQLLWQPRQFEVTDVSRKPLNKAKTLQHTAEA
jgi:hypothetical protein